MRLSDKGKDLLKELEGLRLTAYRCSADVWTIGYGSTRGVKEGMQISRNQAEDRLTKDLEQFENVVNREVAFDLSQQQYDACVLLAFNIGVDAFAKSTLVKKLNQGKPYDAAAQFDRWVYVGKKVNKGLKARRAKEKALFLEGTGRPELPPLKTSKIINGSAASGTAVIALAEIDTIKQQLEPLIPYADHIKVLFVVLGLAGALLAMYARLRQRKKGLA